nr:putative reverse transcriptase domain-containing protein [Tanacetum cinerariifolium]
MNCKLHSFNGSEGVVRLKHWFEKMKQVFEICKCTEDDKVKFAMCTLKGRALTWWNKNVQTLGLANANQIPWGNVKAMMTTEIMSPKILRKKSVKKLLERLVAKAIEEYEKTRTDSSNAGGSRSTYTGGIVAPEVKGCSYKAFMNCKLHSFNGSEGVVRLKHWFEKMEQVFEICKCTEDDKVKFAMCTLKGRALKWWNKNVQTLGLANANQIPWGNVKAMMTT